ncbi:MAG: hypothetical protein J0L94_06870 [Rhodothermia bacterium]|nr:hypothetical protein [Rhodothermia bacterium]
MNHPTTLRDKIAQLLFVRIGSNMPPAKRVNEDENRILDMIQEWPIGGLCLFNGLYPAATETLKKLQKAVKYPLLVGTDMERGVGQQMRPATVFPHVMAFQAMGNAEEAVDLVEEFARIGAREALAMGVHIAFAPVADVSRNPNNPIIATRAFSTEPEEAGRLVEAFIRGSRAEGLLTCPKHFPGHGNTDQDSHEELAQVTASKAEMAQFDLPPFKQAFEAGAELVMTAHVAFPALDDLKTPATASHKILVTLLRHEMGFTGAVITDSLLMGGIGPEDQTEADMAVMLINAGADILLDVRNVPEIVLGVERAVISGILSEARIDEALNRVWKLKTHFVERFGADFFEHPEKYFADVQIGDSAMQERADEMALKAVQVQKSNSAFYPLPDTNTATLVVLLKPFSTPLDPPEQPLADALRALFPRVRYEEVSDSTHPAELDALLEIATKFQQVVVAPIVKPAAWHRFGLKPHHQTFVETLIAQQPVVLASLGSPQLFAMLPEAAVHICTFSDMAPSQRALAVALANGK